MGDAYRDGKVHVLAERCQTCIFRPGAFQGLRPGRRAEMVLEARRNNSAIICHETYDLPMAVCRGFFDLPRPTQTLQVAERIGIIEFVPPPVKEFG